MSYLSKLLCGNVRQSDSGDLAKSLWHLSNTFKSLEPHLLKVRKKRYSLDRLITPFIVRSTIELACTILIARIDPFRILTIAKVQGQATYDTSVKVASAVQWRGDIISDKVNQLWKMDRKSKDMTRALFGDYQDNIFWQPAYLRFLDYVQKMGDGEAGPWLSELLNIDPEGFIPRLRGEAKKIYSESSKGIHHEFVLSISSYYDDATLDQLTEDVLRLVSTMGIIANFSEIVAYGVNSARALTYYKALQK